MDKKNDNTEVKTVDILLSLMPSGVELAIELHIDYSGKKIKQEILALVDKDTGEPFIPSLDNEGHKIIYELISDNGKIHDNETLEDLKIQNGDSISMVPDLIAG